MIIITLIIATALFWYPGMEDNRTYRRSNRITHQPSPRTLYINSIDTALQEGDFQQAFDLIVDSTYEDLPYKRWKDEVTNIRKRGVFLDAFEACIDPFLEQ